MRADSDKSRIECQAAGTNIDIDDKKINNILLQCCEKERKWFDS